MSKVALAKAPILTPSFTEFRSVCSAYRKVVGDSPAVPSPIGQITYQPVGSLERSQSTFSFDRVLKAMAELKERGGLPESGFAHDDARSVYPVNRRVSGILYRGRIYITDGHHRALISTYLQAKTIPVELVADWSHKSRDDFFADLAANNFSSYLDLHGVWTGPGPFCEMLDDPYIFLARKLLRRIDLNYDPATKKLEILKNRGSDSPIGLKLNRDVPFLEQEIARRLRQGGIVWKKGEALNRELQTRALQILRRDRDDSRLKEVLLLERPTPIVELDVEAVILEHFKRINCEFQLTNGDQD